MRVPAVCCERVGRASVPEAAAPGRAGRGNDAFNIIDLKCAEDFFVLPSEDTQKVRLLYSYNIVKL